MVACGIIAIFCGLLALFFMVLALIFYIIGKIYESSFQRNKWLRENERRHFNFSTKMIFHLLLFMLMFTPN